ncbi:unnamed protein product, partial [Didymodactylos carnosus]
MDDMNKFDVTTDSSEADEKNSNFAVDTAPNTSFNNTIAISDSVANSTFFTSESDEGASLVDMRSVVPVELRSLDETLLEEITFIQACKYLSRNAVNNATCDLEKYLTTSHLTLSNKRQVCRAFGSSVTALDDYAERVIQKKKKQNKTMALATKIQQISTTKSRKQTITTLKTTTTSFIDIVTSNHLDVLRVLIHDSER